jgi:tetratricopeptide (TPR) repeat protein
MMRTWTIVAASFLTAVVGVGAAARTPTQTQIQIQTQIPMKAATGQTGSEACSGCHSEIYRSYSKTVMAKASGLAVDGLITGEFNDNTSGVRYRVYKQDEHAWMNYERQSEKFRGQDELLYFIGSGRKGRSYLFSVQGFLFETPINWYSQEGRWGMTPAYFEAREIPLNLPAFTDCMNCHSSGLQPPLPGMENKFAGAPFSHAGVTCQRCHGAGEGHGAGKAPIVDSSNDSSTSNALTSNSSGADSANPNPSEARASSGDSTGADSSIVNPAKLPADRRDAICMECHFEGTVAVNQPGKHLYQFQPGERLSDYIHYFLLSGNQPETARALSQVEALSLSECKRRSGDKMWCGSCHDPHAEPAAEKKAAYYRDKCLNCHGEQFAVKHHPDKPDCTQCHMPALPSKDVAHTESTDHRILRYPKTLPLPRLQVRGTEGAPLVSFPDRDAPLATTRDFALAWETLVQKNVEGAAQRAEQYLRKAVAERPDDPVLLAALGFVEQKHGREKEARELYERALQIDPLANEATTNLGILEARSGNLRRAVELWQEPFKRAPYRSAIGMNLAMAFCAAGQKQVAQKYVQQVLEFNPDYLKGKQLLAHLKEEPGQCKP